MAAPQERVLVLAVDRDGDLERKTRIRSPVFGKDAVLAAATALARALADEGIAAVTDSQPTTINTDAIHVRIGRKLCWPLQ